MAALLLLLAPVPASAHAILTSSQPPSQGVVPAGARELVLRFNSRVDRTRSRLTLEGTNARMILPLEPGQAPETLAAKTDLTPGHYVAHWQVLAIDGHVTRGEIRFSVTPK